MEKEKNRAIHSEVSNKQKIRKIAKTVLMNLTKESRKLQETQVIRYLSEIPQWKEAKTIALTKSMEIEFSTENIVTLARNQGKQIVVPITFPNRQMRFAYWYPQTEFWKNAFGIEEPIDPIWVNEEEIDLVIVPGLAYSKKGERLGFGGGYYDCFLSQGEYDTVSLAYMEQVYETALWDVEKFDIPVEWVITTEGVIHVNELLEKRKI
jgi:5-formyltetrahydrofolate cyclo-ligase